MKKIHILILISAFVFTACNGNKEKNTTETERTEAIVKDSIAATTNIAVSYADNSMLAKIPLRDFPITDSTRFENFEKYGIPDTGLLKKINFDPRRKDATNFRINYRVPFSENFSSVVVTYRCGENELFTTLITIDKQNKIIDKLNIAYDEVAESAFSKTSKIEKDKIIVTSNNWMNEEPIFETETYTVESNGKFNME
ncbi:MULTISPECIES: hypothetical protein [Sphingobacterium]|uniref:hypothetical protein n=1 Tax=Sphingobacterium TaxID=28453 RepID=UPI0028B04112|nr:hypothetical protein [Sphingobacterium multivorum]